MNTDSLPINSPAKEWLDPDGLGGFASGNSHEPLWYYNFLYEDERARGLDCEEDLAAPGVLTWDLAQDNAGLILTTEQHASSHILAGTGARQLLESLRQSEKNRHEQFASTLKTRPKRKRQLVAA